MKKPWRLSSTRRRIVTLGLVIGLSLALPATFFIQPVSAGMAEDPEPSGNEQNGDNESNTEQGGSSNSGDAVAGQVVGATANDDTSIDATNHSRDVDVESGDAEGSNTANSFTGQQANVDDEGFSTAIQLCANTFGEGDVVSLGNVISCAQGALPTASNSQGSDNVSDLVQAAEASTGDAVGGQVIGVASAGPTDIVAANSSEDIDVTTGDSEATNDATIFVGLLANALSAETVLIDFCANVVSDGGLVLQLGNAIECISEGSAAASNTQDGDNNSEVDQSANAVSGDGVGGQVIGVTGSGSTSIDATNSSRDVDIETGDAISSNVADVFVGLLADATGGGGTAINICGNVVIDDGDEGGLSIVAPILNDTSCVIDNSGVATNDHTGDNASDLAQAANATSGDGVGGQVIGAVTSGTTDIVAANTSEDVSVETGDADSTNEADVGVGLAANAASETLLALNICGNVVNSAEDGGDAVVVPIANDVECEINGAEATNEQVGDNSSDLAQAADATSGDGVGGQVLGVVSSGDTSIDATNSSEDVDIETGDAESFNDADVAVGLLADASSGSLLAINLCGNIINSADDDLSVVISLADDVECESGGSEAGNEQTGDNESDLGQSANAVSGDGVGGQVIGAVTSGTTDIVAANTSEDVDIETGDSDSTNLADVDVGLSADSATGSFAALNVCGNIVNSNTIVISLFNDIECSDGVESESVQDGDNVSDLAQASDATTGDGVGGQVIGAVSSGNTSIDATNRSADVDIETGEADSFNNATVGAGLLADSESGALLSGNICGNSISVEGLELGLTVLALNDVDCEVGAESANEQTGDNFSDLAQAAAASSGDGVGGQVLGAVSSGSTDIVAANTSEDVDVETGDADSSNTADVAVGLGATSAQDDLAVLNICLNSIGIIADTISIANDVECTIGAESENVQEGENASDMAQAANATTGDGVAGQVIGAVSSGDTSIDATNASSDVDVETGDTDAANDADLVVGLVAGAETDLGVFTQVCATDITVIGLTVRIGDDIQCELVGEASNEMTGDIDSDLEQSANASSGDGVAGQVAGVVTSAGGSADLVLANTSEDVDLESGSSDHNNSDEEFVGQQSFGEPDVIGTIF